MNSIGWTDAELRESAEKSNEINDAYMRGYKQAKKEFERPKGEWIPMSPDCRGYSESFKCSICGAYIYPRCLEKELDYNCCPYCGADMGGEENNE